MIIVIDGPAGTGKSTVAKGVAKKLGFTFFETGAMYRSFAWLILKENIDPNNKQAVIAKLPDFAFEIKEEKKYFVCGVDVTEAIRQPQISTIASQIAVYPEVRSEMVQIQRKLAKGCNAVFEGRDMGTVVFPKADVKVFLTAKPEIRAERRYKELQEKFPEKNIELEQILKETKERDETDSTRAVSPLKQASDAHLIDTSDLSADDVITQILKLVPYPKKKLFYAFVYWFARSFFKLFFRLKIYGIENLRVGGGILAANHSSNFDPPVLSISCPEEVHFLAKESLFHIFILGWIIRRLNSHPVARSSSDITTFRELVRLVREGKKVIVFPEGGRSKDGELRPIQRGLSFIVQKGGCPIFPAYIQGTFEAWPTDKKLPKLFGKISVTFGKPIEWSEFEHLDRKEAERLLNQRVEEALKNLKNK